MRLITKLVVLLVVSLIVGCTAVSYNYTPERIQISKPPLNTINIAHVGDDLVVQGNLAEIEELYVPYKVEVKVIDVFPGHYKKIGEKDGKIFFSVFNRDTGENVPTPFLGDPIKSLMVYKNELCRVTADNVYRCQEGIPYEIRKRKVFATNDFQQSLIYNGRVGNKLNIGYREFTSNFARPAFSNNVEYDLNDSNIIRYKGAVLEVIKATNQEIKYKVISNFNLAKE